MWTKNQHRIRDLPPFARQLLGALSFQQVERPELRALQPEHDASVLDLLDRWQLAFPLYARCSQEMPERLRKALEHRLRANEVRWEKLEADYKEVAECLRRFGIAHLVLTGFSQQPLFTHDVRYRQQYDFDLLIRPEQAVEAERALNTLGYHRYMPKQAELAEHLPPLVRKTKNWCWRGDYFDPGIPISIELHTRCWNKEGEHFGPEDLHEEFWQRETVRSWRGITYSALSGGDAITYSALHVLRHVLHGNGKPSHIYELAYLLNTDQQSVWDEWRKNTPEQTRAIAAISLELANCWFHAYGSGRHAPDYETVALGAKQWLERYAASPVASYFKANKDELWLNLALVNTLRHRFAVARRRLVPSRLPGAIDGAHLKTGKRKPSAVLRAKGGYLRFVCQRVAFHLQALGGTLREAHAGMRLGRPKARREAAPEFTRVLQSGDK